MIYINIRLKQWWDHYYYLQRRNINSQLDIKELTEYIKLRKRLRELGKDPDKKSNMHLK